MKNVKKWLCALLAAVLLVACGDAGGSSSGSAVSNTPVSSSSAGIISSGSQADAPDAQAQEEYGYVNKETWEYVWPSPLPHYMQNAEAWQLEYWRVFMQAGAIARGRVERVELFFPEGEIPLMLLIYEHETRSKIITSAELWSMNEEGDLSSQLTIIPSNADLLQRYLLYKYYIGKSNHQLSYLYCPWDMEKEQYVVTFVHNSNIELQEHKDPPFGYGLILEEVIQTEVEQLPSRYPDILPPRYTWALSPFEEAEEGDEPSEYTLEAVSKLIFDVYASSLPAGAPQWVEEYLMYLRKNDKDTNSEYYFNITEVEILAPLRQGGAPTLLFKDAFVLMDTANGPLVWEVGRRQHVLGYGLYVDEAGQYLRALDWLGEVENNGRPEWSGFGPYGFQWTDGGVKKVYDRETAREYYVYNQQTIDISNLYNSDGINDEAEAALQQWFARQVQRVFARYGVVGTPQPANGERYELGTPETWDEMMMLLEEVLCSYAQSIGDWDYSA